MLLNGRKVTVILPLTVLVFMICIIGYRVLSHLSSTHKLSLLRTVLTEPVYKNRSGVETFIISETEVTEALFGIRNRNCHALNQFQDPEKRSFICNSLQQCNLASSAVQGLPEGCKRRLPKCIIIGVAKSGTRELIDFLSMHPNIVIRSLPRYMLSFYNKHWEKGVEWHRKQMPFSFKDQIPVYKANYFYKQEVPARMKISVPDIKLILIVRDPADRLISFYTFNMPKKPLTGLIRFAEESGLEQWYYDKPFEQYLRHFSRAQIHVIDSEKFKNDPQNVLFEVERFLEKRFCF